MMNMDGVGSATRITTENLQGPKIAITYDRVEKRIFWTDEKAGKIVSVDINGLNIF